MRIVPVRSIEPVPVIPLSKCMVIVYDWPADSIPVAIVVVPEPVSPSGGVEAFF
jgi:hypothetical protein